MIHQTLLEQAKVSNTVCQHCGVPLPKPETSTSAFCCPGCAAAHSFILEQGLDQFYELAQDHVSSRYLRQGRRHDYQIFDESGFQADFVTKGNDQQHSARLLVMGLQCYGCAWLIERALRRRGAVAYVQPATGETEVAYVPAELKLSEICAIIETLGYRVSPLRHQQNGHDTTRVFHMGAALFCFGNTMLLASAEYFADPGSISRSVLTMFRSLALLLACGSVMIAFRAFGKPAFQQLRQKRIGLDVPILIALLGSFAISAYHVFIGAGEVYFDSITAVIALMLVGRLLQTQALKKAQLSATYEAQMPVEYVRRIDSQSEQVVPLAQIRTGDRLVAYPGDILPLRCRALDVAEISYESINGEPTPKTIHPGDPIDCGAVCMHRPLTAEALQNGSESYLIRLKRASAQLLQNQGKWALLSERMAQVFVFAVLIAAAWTFLWLWQGGQALTATNRAVALLLVSCPCVFGIGVPLVFTRALSLAHRSGIAIRSQQALEQLAAVRTFAFDKTGTLTTGQLSVKAVRWTSALPTQLSRAYFLNILATMVNQSQHHAAQALAAWLRQQPELILEDNTETASMTELKIREQTGLGLEGRYGNSLFRIGSQRFCGATFAQQGQLFVSCDNRVVLEIDLEDSIQPESREVLAFLQRRGARIVILSGDQMRSTTEVARQIGVDPANSQAEQSPTGKALFFQKSAEPTAMVGNGFNDTLALAKAHVGIAIQDAAAGAQDSASIVLSQTNLWGVVRVWLISRGALAALKRVFAFSVLYNSAAMGLAIQGFIAPVVAALAMPVSSAVVMLLAIRWRIEEVGFGSPVDFDSD